MDAFSETDMWRRYEYLACRIEMVEAIPLNTLYTTRDILLADLKQPEPNGASAIIIRASNLLVGVERKRIDNGCQPQLPLPSPVLRDPS